MLVTAAIVVVLVNLAMVVYVFVGTRPLLPGGAEPGDVETWTLSTSPGSLGGQTGHGERRSGARRAAG